jgi:hypothetical protein
MFALFTAAFSSIFIAIGVAAVVGHVVLIDLLMRPAPLQVAQAPAAEFSRVTR